MLGGLVLTGCETTSPTPSGLLALPREGELVPGPSLSSYPPEDVEFPRAITQVAPEYPFELRRERVTGAVKVKFNILPNGRTAAIQAVGSPHPKLAEAAIAAVTKWRFTPAKIRGRIVGVGDVIQLVEFRIN